MVSILPELKGQGLPPDAIVLQVPVLLLARVPERAPRLPVAVRLAAMQASMSNARNTGAKPDASGTAMRDEDGPTEAEAEAAPAPDTAAAAGLPHLGDSTSDASMVDGALAWFAALDEAAAFKAFAGCSRGDAARAPKEASRGTWSRNGRRSSRGITIRG